MTPTRTVAAAGTLSLVAALLAGAAQGAAAAPADHKSVKFTFTEIQTSYEDTFGDGFDTGDSFSFTAKLLRDGKKVGTDKGTCTIESLQGPKSEPTGGSLRCKVTFKLKAGKVKARGVDEIDFNDPTPKFRFPIVSGTGKYAGAAGTLTVVQLTDTKSRVVLKFDY